MGSQEMEGNIVEVDAGTGSLGEISYEESVNGIQEGLERAKQAFIQIGWHLLNIKEKGLYSREGYSDIYEFAEGKFRLSRSTASRFINLCEQFSAGQGSPVIDGKYENYSMSQLVEILPMSQAERDKVTPEMTVKEIREIKKGARMPEHAGIPVAESKAGKKNSWRGGCEEQMEWLLDVEKWGLWYEDPNIHARYYKYAFPDGSQLIAVRRWYTCPPYMREQPETYQEQIKADGSYYGEPEYHMVYSENFWEMFPNEFRTDYQKYYSSRAAEPEEVMNFMDWLLEWEESGRYWRAVELDAGHLERKTDKSLPFLTRKYMEIYEKIGYIPEYFDPKSCREINGDEPAPTLTTSSGGFAGVGSIDTFDFMHNVLLILNSRISSPDMRKNRLAGLIRVANAKVVELAGSGFSYVYDNLAEIWDSLRQGNAQAWPDEAAHKPLGDKGFLQHLINIRMKQNRIGKLAENMACADRMPDGRAKEKEYEKIMQAASPEERKCIEQRFGDASVREAVYGLWKADYEIWKGALEQAREEPGTGVVEFWVRKLTEAEAFRLMGVPCTEEDIRELKARGVKASTLYEVAGEGVPAPLSAVFLKQITKGE